jgi:Ni,Fe-hydrogenase I cytochrome b subunit
VVVTRAALDLEATTYHEGARLMTPELLSESSRILAGILVISLVTVETGGLYLVRVVGGRAGEVTPFQLSFSRAGHAHAGVLLILALLCMLFAETTELTGFWFRVASSGVAVAALVMPAGFFLSALGAGRDRPNQLILLVYLGATVLAVTLTVLGVGLLMAGR